MLASAAGPPHTPSGYSDPRLAAVPPMGNYSVVRPRDDPDEEAMTTGREARDGLARSDHSRHPGGIGTAGVWVRDREESAAAGRERNAGLLG